jgi:hypothetical protein
VTQFLLFLHIGGAILLVGEILFATIWLRSSLAGGPEPRATRYVIGTMALTTRGIAVPAFYVNMTSGILLGFVANIHWLRAIWLIVSIVLYSIMASLWQGTLIPLRRMMAEEIDRAGAGPLPVAFEPMARRWVRTSGAVLALFAAILGLMIWRPTI